MYHTNTKEAGSSRKLREKEGCRTLLYRKKHASTVSSVFGTRSLWLSLAVCE